MLIDVSLLLSHYKCKLSLLLTISQSRSGATEVLNAGLFSAIRASGIFSVDPDIGLGQSLVFNLIAMLIELETDNPQALRRYHEMLLYLVRVITSLVLSRGSQNAQTIEQARLFLIENRPSVVTMLKRHAKVGSQIVNQDDVDGVVNELAEYYVLLISLTRFLEVRLFERESSAVSLTNFTATVRGKAGYSEESKSRILLVQELRDTPFDYFIWKYES